MSLALGAEATFVARTVDTDKPHLAETLRAAAAHEGAALVEIYQNCNVFNDGAFDAVRAKGQREVNQIRLVHGEPIRLAPKTSAAWPRRRRPPRFRRRGRGGRTPSSSTTLSARGRAWPSSSPTSSRPTGPTPIGVLRSVSRPVYGQDLAFELERRHAEVVREQLHDLLPPGETWTVS